MLFSLLLSCVALFRNSFNEISLSEFNLVSQPLRYYTKYLIEMQHFYSDCYITDCCIAHAAAAPPSVALCQNRQASTNSYIMRTSRPRGRRAFCQNRQASAHGPRTSSLLTHYLHLLYARRPWIPGKLLSEQTSKHPVNKGFQSLPHSYIMRTSRCGPGRPGKLLSEQTSKQLSTGYSQFMAKLSTALPHELSSVAQEPWSPVHMGSVFSPWTTNDSTWDA